MKNTFKLEALKGWLTDKKHFALPVMLLLSLLVMSVAASYLPATLAMEEPVAESPPAETFGESIDPTDDEQGHLAGISQPNHPYAPGVVLVGLKPHTATTDTIRDLDTLDQALPQLSARLEEIGVLSMEPLTPPTRSRSINSTTERHPQRQDLRLHLPENADIQDAIALLEADPSVAYAEPDYLASFASEPNDPRYAEQWGLAQVNAEAAWSLTHGSPGVVIAVIDSGLDLDHEDLAPNLWVNPGEIPGSGLDDDNNGFIDDIWGWNFVDKNNNLQDFVGHGTHVAGVAAARTDNELGIAGVAGQCQIMPVKVSQISGFANYSDIAAGVYYAVGKGAHVINISLGGYANSVTLQNAIDHALEHNVVVVAGAGNDNKHDPFYPAAYAGVIAVAGTDPEDVKTDHSNYGDWIDLTAPGVNIISTTLGGYSTGSGTSYAAPFVSGAAGLLLSLNPDWTPAMVRSQLMQTADDTSDQNPEHPGLLGAGRLNVAASLQPPQPILTYTGYSGNGTVDLRPEFGSTVSLKVNVYNDWADAVAVSGTLTSSDPHVTITQDTADFGTILSGQNRANTTPFSFDIAPEAGYSHTMAFTLDLIANDGDYTVSLHFEIQTRSSIENVSGTISSDTTWTRDKTYRVTGNVGIAPGNTLTIESGTTVQFAGDHSLNVGGTLVARGTAKLPIIFEHETAGQTWNRIFFDTPSEDAQVTEEGVYQSGNILEHVRLYGAEGGIACSSATPYLNQVRTDRGGMNASLGSTNLWLVDTHLTGELTITEGGAEPETLLRVTVTGGDAELPAASVTGSTFSGDLTIAGAGQVSGSRAGHVQINGMGSVQDSILRSLTISGVGDVKQVTATGPLQVGSNSTVENCTLTGGTIRAGTGSTITRNSVESAAGDAIVVTGTGTVTYNRVVGANKGIVVTAGTVENNLVAETSDNGLEPGTAAVRHNTLIGIEGHAVYLAQVPAAFEHNNFEFNSGDYDVYLAVPKSVQINVPAQNNWWGTTEQDEIKARVYDFEQDYNLARLITTLPLTQPSQSAPGYVRGVTLDPASPVGIQTVAFTAEFSRPMGEDEDPLLMFESANFDFWETKTPMPTARRSLGVAAGFDGRIYAIGGRVDGSTSIVEAYDPITDSWTTLAPMPTARHSLGVAAGVDGRIYAIGGRQGHGVSNIVESYDPETDSWTTLSPMPTARETLGVATGVDGRIYAIGGHISSAYTNIVEAYDPITDTWTTLSPMSTRRSNLGVAAGVDGRIYSIGGVAHSMSEPDNAVEAYDHITDTWTGMNNMPTARESLGVTAGVDGRIYTIGGYFGPLDTDITNIVEVYTPAGFNKNSINANPQWLDETHYTAHYDFTALNPRGDYRVLVSGATDPDGILIAPHTGTTFTIDYAGEIADPTPPPAPQVLAWGDGGLTQLTGRAYVDDPDAVITGYRYAIGSAPGGTNVVNWTNTSQTQITRTGLQLQPGMAYYVSFQSRNAGGIWSDAGISNAVVDGSQLSAPTLSTLQPSTADAGDPGFTLTVNGKTFIEESVVRWNGQARPTTFISPTQLQAQISAADIAAAGQATITVFTPAPGGGTSNGLTFTIAEGEIPAPNYTLTVNSANPSTGVVITSTTGHGGTTSYSHTLASDTSVTLTAPEFVGSGADRKRFDRWSGASASTNRTITITMGEDKTVTANYIDDPEYSDNADLSSLEAVPGPLEPAFRPATTSYTVDVTHDTETVDITATAADQNASITVNGLEVSSGETETVELNGPGTATGIEVVVTAQDGETGKTYSITVNRALSPDQAEWSNLTPASADVLTSGGGVLALSFENTGIWINSGDWVNLASVPAVALATDGTILVAAIENYGTWLYDGDWQQITAATASILAADDGKVAASFEGHGIWHYNAGDWQQLTTATARALAYGDGKLVASVEGFGTWLNDGEWHQIAPFTAQILAISDSDIVASFEDLGTWRYSGDWSNLTPAAATALALDGGVLVVSVDGFGIWLNDGQWRNILDTDARHLAIAGETVAASFDGHGVWLYR